MKKKKKVVICLFGLAAFACLAALWILAGEGEKKRKEGREGEVGRMEVHFLDAGQGDSIFISSEEETMLIDAGTNEDGGMVVSYLKKLGIEHLDYVIATHPHIDHIGGMDTVLENFSVGLCFLPGETYDTESFAEVVDVIKKREIQTRDPEFLENYEIGSGRFTFLTSREGRVSDDINDTSLGIRLTNGTYSFLLCGDMSASVEEQILDTGISIQSDVMKLNHHGSSDANSMEFLEAVSPSYVVVTCGRRNEFGHPHQKVMNRVEKIGAGVFRTDKQGAIVFFMDQERLESSPEPEIGREKK